MPRWIKYTRFLSAIAVLLALVAPASADEGLEFFEKRIRPVLAQHCYKCHSTQSTDVKGKLLLDTREGTRKGGESGPAVVPGKPQESWLLTAIAYDGTFYDMPPSGKLPPAVIADFQRWIEIGPRPDPRDKPAAGALAWEQVLAGRKSWWSLQPVKNPPVPAVRQADWSSEPIDRFLLDRLEAAGLAPAVPADPRALIRRLSFVLTGLPPTAEEVEEFVRACSQSPRPQVTQSSAKDLETRRLGDWEKAYAALVDKLLASPHFGERWARHWMDVVRFGETHGYEWNFEIGNAWRYRDYLIRAFNQDVPYDKFVSEHIAGDLMTSPRSNQEEQFNESLLGTCFYRFGEVSHDCYAFRETSLDVLDNQLDTLTKAFQATTVACARCHDHKLDAVSQKDYYALLGILASSRTATRTIDFPLIDEWRGLFNFKDQLDDELPRKWRYDALDVAKYLLAGQAAIDKQDNAADLAKGLDTIRLQRVTAALKNDKGGLEDPLSLWRAVVKAPVIADAWRTEVERYRGEQRQRTEFNAANFTPVEELDDLFDEGSDGLGLLLSDRGGIALALSGDNVVTGIYPDGYYTHLLSDRLNGALRLPYMTGKKQKISFRVIGDGYSALRPVTDNCVIGENYQLLKDGRWSWITQPAIHKQPETRLYYELVTVQDNPRLPERYGRLKEVPEAALAEPHSYFGVTQIVLHDCTEPPRDELKHLNRLLIDSAPKTLEDLAERYARATLLAVRSWSHQEGGSSGLIENLMEKSQMMPRDKSHDAVWLDYCLRNGFLNNSLDASPEIAELAKKYRAAERKLRMPSVVPAMADIGDGFDLTLPQVGGSPGKGEVVPRRYLEAVSGTEPFEPQGSGRAELSEALIGPTNPFTARVMVNRIWQHLFGAGLVRTPDDFGQMGDLPSHPELLDHLATRFVAEGWSMKKLIRTLVLTRAFQMASRPSPEAKQVDPENRLLQHYPARRLEAEAIRDSLLAVSGRLDRKLYGPSIQPPRARTDVERRLWSGPLDGDGRRSIYTKVTLMEGPAFLMAFNFPDAKTAVGRRDVTNVPGQALALLNDPLVIQQAEVWAKRLVSVGDANATARIDRMFLAAIGRPPEASERERFTALVGQFAELHGIKPDDVINSEVVWKDVAHALFNLREFIYIY